VVEGNPFFSFLFYKIRFGGSCHSFYLFYLFRTFIITFIQYVHSYPFTEASLPFLHFISSFITIYSSILFNNTHIIMYTITINVQYACYSTGLKIKYYYYCLFRSEGKTSLGCRAGIWTRACHKAGQRTTNWAMLHPIWAMLHPIWAMLHPIEPRCTLYVSLWRYTEFRTWKKSRNYRTRNSAEFRGILGQFRTEYGIDGSKKNRRNYVSTEFRGHPTLGTPPPTYWWV
jgi:hypothetical protein